MTALAEAIADQWLPVQRDLIALGFRCAPTADRSVFAHWVRDDQPLHWTELLPICLAAHPGTALFHRVSGGWDRTAEMVANQLEYQAGHVQVARRFPRPGVPATAPAPVSKNPFVGTPGFQSMPLEEFERLRQANYARGPAKTA